MIARLTLGLGAKQITCVALLFVITLVGAIILAYAFRKWNLYHA